MPPLRGWGWIKGGVALLQLCRPCGAWVDGGNVGTSERRQVGVTL